MWLGLGLRSWVLLMGEGWTGRAGWVMVVVGPEGASDVTGMGG